jgi:hypothetical protein
MRSERGQLAFPLYMVLLAMAAFVFVFVANTQKKIRQMRLQMVADAASLSCARAQAGQLNEIAVAQEVMSLYVLRYKWGAGTLVDARDALETHIDIVKKLVQTFPGRAVAAGQVVARENGIRGGAIFWPARVESHLVPMYLAVVFFKMVGPIPVPVWVGEYDEGYWARAWSPGYAHAQPPHRTTWMVQKYGQRAAGTARAWLDVDPHSLVGNGAFPRVNESMLRDVSFQGFWPHFNARLDHDLGVPL